jgi:hypothetical protein
VLHLHSPIKRGLSLVAVAVRCGHHELTEKLLALGADINVPDHVHLRFPPSHPDDQSDHFPLFSAVESADPPLMEVLLRFKAKVNWLIVDKVPNTRLV